MSEVWQSNPADGLIEHHDDPVGETADKVSAMWARLAPTRGSRLNQSITNARHLRQALVMHARWHCEPDKVASQAHCVGLLEMDRALKKLAAVDPEVARTCELYYFGGHARSVLARLLDVSETVIDRQLRLASAWLVAPVKAPR